MSESEHSAAQDCPAEVRAWLESFALAVRERDFDKGRALFSEEVIGFGTVQACADGLEELAQKQWGAVWPVTEHFDFDHETVSCMCEGGFTMVMATWSSEGFKENGERFTRRGRATIGLVRQGGAWKAIHTHFSLNPS